MKLSLIIWGARMVARYGWPRRFVTTYLGMGDELMTAAAFRELQSRHLAKRVWLMTRYPEIWRESGIESTFVPWDARAIRLAQVLKIPSTWLHYIDDAAPPGVDRPFPGHAIATFCRQLGIRGSVALKPHLILSAEEKAAGRRFSRQIVIQSSNSGGNLAIPLKKWPIERFQRVADALIADGWRLIQLGSKQEPLIAGVTDLRGQTSIRESAAILAQSRLFVGLVGGLMHLARAVDCPSVVIYGGREAPELAGYAANSNLTGLPACAPCYFHNHCPNNLECMTMIEADEVIAAARSRIGQPSADLAVEWAQI